MNDIAMLDRYGPDAPPISAALLAATHEMLATEIADAPRRTSHPRLGGSKPRRVQRKRIAVALTSAAVLAAGLTAFEITVPAHSPGAPTSAVAATLHHLVAVAQARPVVGFGPGSYLHQIETVDLSGEVDDSVCVTPTVAAQNAASSCQPSVLLAAHFVTESWTSYDGDEWVRQVRDGQTSYQRLQSVLFAPRELGELPSEPSLLLAQLKQRAHANGAPDDADSLVVGVLSNFAPPAVRAAALRILQDDPAHVRVGPSTHDPLGRPGIELDLPGSGAHGGLSVIFDPGTSAILSSVLQKAGNRTLRITANEMPAVVSSVPSSVLNAIATADAKPSASVAPSPVHS